MKKKIKGIKIQQCMFNIIKRSEPERKSKKLGSDAFNTPTREERHNRSELSSGNTIYSQAK